MNFAAASVTMAKTGVPAPALVVTSGGYSPLSTWAFTNFHFFIAFRV